MRSRFHRPTELGNLSPPPEVPFISDQDIEWKPTQFNGISIKVLYEDKAKGEMTCLLKWEPGATLPMHQHPAIEQSYVIEGSFYDHDGVCRAGEFVWRRVGSFHETRSNEGAVILAVYRQPNIFRHSSGCQNAGAPSSDPLSAPAMTSEYLCLSPRPAKITACDRSSSWH